MPSNDLQHWGRQFAFYLFGAVNFVLFLVLFIVNGQLFSKPSEKDQHEFAIARDRFWNLQKAPLPGFKHFFCALRNNIQLHYISNRDGPNQGQRPENLVIFLHGFPDSSMMWRHLMKEDATPVQSATLVCVDLPGYGGSDSLEKYDTQVLEALTEFIIMMREKYIPAEDFDLVNTYVVGHDWGCILGFRLAAEAPCLADRFILTNAPHPELAFANRDRILNSASKIFKQFKQSPWGNFGCLTKSLKTLRPLLIQTLMMGYVFMFHLPLVLVTYIGTCFNLAFIRGALSSSYRGRRAEFKVQECLASTFGPGPEECSTSLSNGSGNQTYGRSVMLRGKSAKVAFWTMTGYYRDGVGSKPWSKSLETIADLYALETSASESSSPGRRRSSVSHNSLFTEQYKGGLKAPAFVLWGEKDQACSRPICLDGLGDYLARDSEIALLPNSGHWTPVEAEARVALAKVIGLYAGYDAKAVPRMTEEVKKVYKGAALVARK